jgi:hypothetical protein
MVSEVSEVLTAMNIKFTVPCYVKPICFIERFPQIVGIYISTKFHGGISQTTVIFMTFEIYMGICRSKQESLFKSVYNSEFVRHALYPGNQ